jgi:hypothetical protein
VGADSFGAFSPGFGGGYGGSNREREQVILSAGVLADSCATSGQRGDTHDPRSCAARRSSSYLGRYRG